MILLYKRDIKFLVFNVTAVFVLFLFVVIALQASLRRPATVKGELLTIVLREKMSSEFHATGYSLGSPYNKVTRSGSMIVNRGAIQICGIDVFTIAVDPKVIPLGSVVYIDSLGLAMATDTGTAIKGMMIDICFQDMGKAVSWGRRAVTLTMIRRGA